MASIVSDASLSKVIIGVDTHKHIHVAVAINQHGTRLGDRAVSADSGGYAQLAAWAQELGQIDRFGIEGRGSYGAGLTSYLRRSGHRVVEVNRGDRRSRRSNGKSDAIDAEAAARSVLAGTSTVIPNTADGLVEMIRQVKVARDTARKGRTSAIITLKTLVVNAPAELRESLDGLTNRALINRCARFRLSGMTSPTASAKHSLRPEFGGCFAFCLVRGGAVGWCFHYMGCLTDARRGQAAVALSHVRLCPTVEHSR